jgi:hypothetical protein
VSTPVTARRDRRAQPGFRRRFSRIAAWHRACNFAAGMEEAPPTARSAIRLRPSLVAAAALVLLWLTAYWFLTVAFVDALPSAPPPAARVALLHRVERAADVSLNSVAVVDAVRIAVRQSLGPVADPASAGQGGPAPFRLPVGEEHRLRVLLSMLFAYRDVSDIDLGRYAAFLESPSGRWLTRVTHQALLAALAADAPSPPSRPGRVTPAAANAAVPRAR